MQVETCGLHVRTFIPLEAEPFHGLENSASHLFARAFDIRILNPQDENAVVLSSVEPVEERGTCSADMQVSSWRRRKTDSNLLLTHRLNLRSAATASRTTSVLGSFVRGRICSVEDGSPILPIIRTIPARTLGFEL